MRLAASEAVALTPQPVADVGGILAHIDRYRTTNAIRCLAGDISRQVATHLKQQVAASVRIPGTIKAARSPIDKRLVAPRVTQHLVVAAHGALEVIRIVSRGAGGRTARGIDPKQRLHTQVACGQQVKICCAGADYAEASACAYQQRVGLTTESAVFR